MAGDWIKMRAGLRTHPKVVRMSSALKADRLRVIGGLHAVWCLADEHTEDGRLPGYTLETLDESIGWPGFSTALQNVDWLIDDAQGLVLPRFEDHNGASAKRRAQDTQRKRLVRGTSASDADEIRTREEKRREEELHSSVLRTSPPPFPQSSAGERQKQNDRNSLPRATRLPRALGLTGADVTPVALYAARPETWTAWAMEQCQNLAFTHAAWERFVDHFVAAPGQKGVKVDWEATWRNWLRKDIEDRRPGTSSAGGKQAALEQRNRQVADAWKPPELRAEEQPALALPADGEPY